MIKNKEYSFSVNNFKKPVSVDGNLAIGTRLMELIMMEPGDDPLHPDMGVGIKTYRYSLNTLDTLRKRIEDQIATYLPFYQMVRVILVQTPSKVINIEIDIGSTKFVYDSDKVSKPITLSDVTSS